MRLQSFSVTNYRSIDKAHRIPISDSTVFIGKNNEGKSNLLAALATAMSVVSELGRVPVVSGRVRLSYRHGLYDWERDFPIGLQESRPDGESIFRLEFVLTELERQDFRSAVGSALNESLPIEIRMGRSDPKFKVVKQGRGSQPLNAKAVQIAKFVGERIEFTYIPAIRTAEESVRVVSRLVGRELASLERNDDYRSAVQRVAELQRPILQQLGNRIESALHGFLPQIVSVDVKVSDDARYRSVRRGVDVIVDDGTPTSLERKGDGVQSLAAIGLLRGLDPSGRDMILALEEPESHLHPNAIHRLRGVIQELSSEHQIVLTTHCPLFVDRVNISTNVIVTGNRAETARSVAQIRELLGVRASDNLRHASLVLVVEGDADRIALQALLEISSPVLKESLRQHTLVVESMSGTSRLQSTLGALSNALCRYHVLLDNDVPGRTASRAAQDDGLLQPIDVQFVSCPGMANSELEDLIDPSMYRDLVRDKFGISLSVRQFRTSKRWSDRVRAAALAQGRDLSPSLERRLKTEIAKLVQDAPDRALIEAKRAAFDALVEALETKLAPPHEKP